MKLLVAHVSCRHVHAGRQGLAQWEKGSEPQGANAGWFAKQSAQGWTGNPAAVSVAASARW